MVGGGLFVGAVYGYLYLTGEGGVEKSFNTGALESAMEAGGPMGRYHPRARTGVIMGVPGQQERNEEEKAKIASPSGGGHMIGDHLPHYGGPLHSAVGQELAAEKYAKRKGSDESEKTAV